MNNTSPQTAHERLAAVTDHSDRELLRRTKARQERDGLSYVEAQRLVLAEDPVLRSAYTTYFRGGPR